MIPNSFSLGPFTVHVYGAIIALAILIGWLIAKKRAHFYSIKPELLDSHLLLLPLVLAIVGGRFYHVIDKWPLYQNQPNQIFAISNGGLGIFGALAGAFVGLWIFAKAKKIDYLSLLDLTAPSLILGQAIGRIGNFINQEGYGAAANMPWGVYFYEAALETAAFIALLFFSRRLTKPGQLFGLYLILYSVARSIGEIWRTDTAQVGDLQAAYIFAFLASLVGIYLIIRTRPKQGLT
ncbi:MAG: prolipoprotein diacylglyceryl transferase [Candidatus Curtissbacteria bacterium]